MVTNHYNDIGIDVIAMICVEKLLAKSTWSFTRNFPKHRSDGIHRNVTDFFMALSTSHNNEIERMHLSILVGIMDTKGWNKFVGIMDTKPGANTCIDGMYCERRNLGFYRKILNCRRKFYILISSGNLNTSILRNIQAIIITVLYQKKHYKNGLPILASWNLGKLRIQMITFILAKIYNNTMLTKSRLSGWNLQNLFHHLYEKYFSRS